MKPLPPPPPISRVPKAVVAQPAAPPVAVSATRTVLGYADLESSTPSVASASREPEAHVSPRHESPGVDEPRRMGPAKQTIFGMPVRAPGAPNAAPTSEPSRAADSEEIPESLPMNDSPWLAYSRQPLFLGAIAALGLVLGFSLVLHLLPRPGPSESVPGVVRERTPPASPPDTTERAAAAGTSSSVSADQARPDPSGSLPGPSPTVALSPAAPKVAPVARQSPSSATAPSRPASPTNMAAKSTSSHASPSAPPAGNCNPPYRTDFFGNKVPKPGCS
jgi:hypothetical protein